MPRKNPMNVFTESSKSSVASNWRTDILNSILLSGNAESDIKIETAKRSQIMDFNASKPRLKRSLVDKFTLILSKPDFVLSEQAIKCCLCGRTINFNNAPVWYYLIKYNVNCFAAFICFDSASPSKPSVKCYRRD